MSKDIAIIAPYEVESPLDRLETLRISGDLSAISMDSLKVSGAVLPASLTPKVVRSVIKIPGLALFHRDDSKREKLLDDAKENALHALVEQLDLVNAVEYEQETDETGTVIITAKIEVLV